MLPTPALRRCIFLGLYIRGESSNSISLNLPSQSGFMLPRKVFSLVHYILRVAESSRQNSLSTRPPTHLSARRTRAKSAGCLFEIRSTPLPTGATAILSTPSQNPELSQSFCEQG